MGRRHKRLPDQRAHRHKRVRDLRPWFDSEGECESGKVRYQDRATAERALAAAVAKREKYGTPKVERRVYPCGYCDGWHKTAMDPWRQADAWDVSQLLRSVGEEVI